MVRKSCFMQISQNCPWSVTLISELALWFCTLYTVSWWWIFLSSYIEFLQEMKERYDSDKLFYHIWPRNVTLTLDPSKPDLAHYTPTLNFCNKWRSYRPENLFFFTCTVTLTFELFTQFFFLPHRLVIMNIHINFLRLMKVLWTGLAVLSYLTFKCNLNLEPSQMVLVHCNAHYAHEYQVWSYPI